MCPNSVIWNIGGRFRSPSRRGDGRKRQWGAGLSKNMLIFEVKCPQNRPNSVIWNMRGRFLRRTGNGGHGVKMGAMGGEKHADF